MAEKKFNANKELDASRWTIMSAVELYEQEILLQSRIDFALRIGNAPLQEQMQRGMLGLQAIIRHKNGSTEDAKVTVIDPHSTIIDRGKQ